MATIPLVIAARAANVAYPIVLVLGGLAIGFLPFVPTLGLPPSAVLAVFLPPLIYWTTVTAPTRAFRIFATPILRQAVGLVVATAAAVAATAHWLVPGLPWPAAAAFGAIVAPTDAVAFSPIAESSNVPQRVVAIVEGESLLNDAVALVLYAAAVSAVVRGDFSWGAAGGQLVWSTLAAIAIGVVAGVLVVRALGAIREPMLAVLATLLAGYLAYIPAQHLGASGVVATVAEALYVTRFTPPSVLPRTRVLTRGAWAVLIFVLNAVIFIVVGLQLRPIVQSLHGLSWTTFVLWALAINAVVVVAGRLAWMMGVAYPIDRYLRSFENVPPWRNYLVISWAGFRGGVSLAAALALPLETYGHVPFPHRDLLIALTFSVILVTLVGQGSTLPLLLRRLRFGEDDDERVEERRAIEAATRSSLERLDELARQGRVDAGAARTLRERYDRHVLDDEATGEVLTLHRTELELLDLQHRAVVRLRNAGKIENTTMQRLETELDFKRLQLEEQVTRGAAAFDD
jgi:CPA1 family monovalent cation:H+ antiporter